MKKTLLHIAIFWQIFSFGQCFEIETILADACGSPEGENEMVLLKINNDMDINTLVFDWPNNSFLGWCSSPSLTVQLNQTVVSSCGLLIEPPLGIVPANSKLLIVSSTNMQPSVNSFEYLTDTLYIIYQCAGNTSGHFSNSSTTARTLTVSNCSITNSVSYIGTSLTGGDGGAVSYVAGESTYYNTGCNAPVPSIHPNWNFPSLICSNYGMIDLNDFLPNMTSGVWSGDIENIHYFNPLNKLGNYSITLSVNDPNNCILEPDSTINFVVEEPLYNLDTVIVCDSIEVNHVGWIYADTIIYVYFPNSNYSCQYSIKRYYFINHAAYSLIEDSVFINSGESYQFEILGEEPYVYDLSNEIENCFSPCFENILSPLDNSTYYINVQNIENSCIKTLELNIIIDYNSKIEFPNIFTPNNDGENDLFKIYGKDIEYVSFSIYSKWGELIFEGNSLNDSWNGTYKDKNIENGLYLMQLKAIGKDKIEFKFIENISLLR